MNLKLAGYFFGPRMYHPIYFKENLVSHLNHNGTMTLNCNYLARNVDSYYPLPVLI